MYAKQHYLSYNNTEFSPDIAEYNLETKNAGQNNNNNKKKQQKNKSPTEVVEFYFPFP